MKVNVEKVLERDNKLSQLDDRAGILYFWDILKVLSKISISVWGIFLVKLAFIWSS